ncbi:MAG: CHASE2 domain-containing protein [Planctomycetota bacterium]
MSRSRPSASPLKWLEKTFTKSLMVRLQRPSEMPLKWLEKALPGLIVFYIALFAASILDARLSFESYWFGDLMFQARKFLELEEAPAASVAFVDIDDQSHRQLRAAVMDRKEHMAPVLEALHDLGARHVVLDIEFFDPVRARLDTELAGRLVAGIDPLVETLARINTPDEFEKQGEIGMALAPLARDLKALTEDPNEAFALSLNKVGSTLGVHWAPSSEHGEDVLVPPEESLARRLDARTVSWGLVNASSCEDGLVRSVQPHRVVGGLPFANLGLSAYLADQGISVDHVVVEDAEMRVGHQSVFLMDSGDMIIDWNSRLEDASLRVPFVRLHDLKMVERAARISLHAAMALEEKEYVRLTDRGDYIARRKSVLDPLKGTLEDLEQGLGRMMPLEPMKALSEPVRLKLEEGRRHLTQWRERWTALAWLKDKVVFMGAAGTSSIDRRPSPISPDAPMVNLHASVYNSLTLGSPLSYPRARYEALGAVLFLCLLALVSFRCGPKMLAITTLGLSTFVSTLGLFFFLQGWLLRSGGSSIEAGGWLITGITSARNLISFKRRQFEKERDSHLTRPVIERVRKAGKPELEGVAHLTVVHLSLGDSTVLTPTLGFHGTRDRIASWVETIKPHVEEHGGVMEPYHGGGLSVFFGAILPGEDPALRACRCALAIKTHIRGQDIGLGLGTSEAVFGVFGTSSAYDLSVVGRCADAARRLSEASKRAGSRILVDEATEAACQGRVLMMAVEVPEAPNQGVSFRAIQEVSSG